MHEVPLAECLERYKRFEDKIDTVKDMLTGLVKSTEKINGKFENHILESIERIREIERHKAVLDDLLSIKLWFRFSVVSFIIAVLGIAIAWGQINRQVDVNTKRLFILEEKMQHDKI